MGVQRRGNRQGFTLIELLVVIAIIAILAAILFPVISRAKARAWLSTCSSNQKQWAAAVMMYVDDNGGRYPCAGANLQYQHTPGTMRVPRVGSATLYDAVSRYTRNQGIRWCPAFVAKIGEGNKAAFGWSYWYFCKHNNTNVSDNASLCSCSTSEVLYSSKKPLIAEPEDVHDSWNGSIYPYNIAYCDGHVATIKLSVKDGWQRLVYVGKNGLYP